MNKIIKKNTCAVVEPFEVVQDFMACVVTDSSRFAEGLAEYLGREHLKVKYHLADLIGEKECCVFIVDSKIDDINLWPAPLLLEPSAAVKPWLFLISRLTDAPLLNGPPTDCVLFERSMDALEKVTAYIRRRFDPESRTRIERVGYVKNARTLVVQMQNGRTYILKVDDLPESDSSDVIRWAVGNSRHYFRVRQESGNWFEVPWDDVLYHCEPEYEYYKGKREQAETMDGDRSTKIGNRVREWRTRRGLSITELAERANMKRPNLSRLEHGQHVPSLETLERVAGALGLPVAELVVASRR